MTATAGLQDAGEAARAPHAQASDPPIGTAHVGHGGTRGQTCIVVHEPDKRTTTATKAPVDAARSLVALEENRVTTLTDLIRIQPRAEHGAPTAAMEAAPLRQRSSLLLTVADLAPIDSMRANASLRVRRESKIPSAAMNHAAGANHEPLVKETNGRCGMMRAPKEAAVKNRHGQAS